MKLDFLHEKMTKKMKAAAHCHITVDRLFCDAVADFIESQEKEPGRGVGLSHIQSQAFEHPVKPFGTCSQKKLQAMLDTCGTVRQIKTDDQIGYVSTRPAGSWITQATLINVADRSTADSSMQSIIKNIQGIRSRIHKRAAGVSFVVSRDELNSIEEHVEYVNNFLSGLKPERN